LAGSVGAAAGILGVEGGVVDVVAVPAKLGGGDGVVGPVVLPAPPSAGGAVDEEVDVVVVDVLVAGSAVVFGCWPPQATVIALIVTTTPTPTAAPSALSFRCCEFTSSPLP
jgi:hypothetical protein